MLSIGLLSLIVAIPLYSSRITPYLFNRITLVLLIYSALIAFNRFYVESIMSGIGIYSGLFQITNISLGVEIIIYLIGAMILLGWSINIKVYSGWHTQVVTPSINEFSLMILFTTIGASFLISSSDLVSMYLSIELQSFAVYILATLYRNSESATAAGLKYFLLGGLSSALILLGTAMIYSRTGCTHLEGIFSIINSSSYSATISTSSDFFSRDSAANTESLINTSILFGSILIRVGFLFKVASAPFHNWAPDVYDGVPTIITSWITTMPKISIFFFLLDLQSGIEFSRNPFEYNVTSIFQNLLLICSILSLLIGTIVGLSQYRIKRLLAFSTISHVGFILLALRINTQESIESFMFYIIQYSITNVNTFLILLRFGYLSFNNNTSYRVNDPKKKGMSITDIQFIDELKGQFHKNPLLSFSFAICLFSMAGIPPLVGFFAKQSVLYSSLHNGYYFMSIIAILVSVISASYYLKIIQVMYFYNPARDSPESTLPLVKTPLDKFIHAASNTNNKFIHSLDMIKAVSSYIHPRGDNNSGVSNAHSVLIAGITMFIILFMIQPTLGNTILNSCHILTLYLFNY